jgi:putative YphP/YqiW family bacilliredoxin
MYPEELVKPIREELTSLGFEELKDIEEVDSALNNKSGATLLVINSVCGCAAGNAWPGIRLALQYKKLHDKLTTMFARQDKEATTQARNYLAGYPPSSPSMALFKEGIVVHMIPRHQIEGRLPQQIAQELIEMFDAYCN